MSDKTPAFLVARRLLLRHYHGVLSTHSVEAPGYPFGSVVPFCLDRQGHPVILISRIAQHTKNVQANPKVSLIVTEDEVDDIQASARLTYLSNATRIEGADTDTSDRYYSYFPQAQDYHKTHDFDFYRLLWVRARFIGGFGAIHWLDADQFLRANPFSADEERGMVRHMNDDHGDAMRHYCRNANVELAAGTIPAMAGIDAEGFHLRLDKRIVRFEFEAAVSSPTQVREALVGLAQSRSPQ